MDTTELRKTVITAYASGTSLKVLLNKYGMGRSWLFKWYKRYRDNPDGAWYEEESRAPKTSPVKHQSSITSEVLAIRNELEQKLFSQTGAISIQYELKHKGLEIPPVWTINRILKAGGKLKKLPAEKKACNEYPQAPLCVDQMDLVGPRYLKSKMRFYSINVISVQTHFAQVNPLLSKDADSVLNGLIRYWQTYGMPDYVQMDNELSFRGSTRYPRSMGKIIKTMLSLGIRPLYIPQKEPWRNGMIEKFNDTYDKKFLSKVVLTDQKDLLDQSIAFENFHNQYHRYSSQSNHTPNEKTQYLLQRTKLSPDYEMPTGKIIIGEGQIEAVRFIRSDLKLKLFGEEFIMPKHLLYSYVNVIIDIGKYRLLVVRDGTIEMDIPYYME